MDNKMQLSNDASVYLNGVKIGDIHNCKDNLGKALSTVIRKPKAMTTSFSTDDLEQPLRTSGFLTTSTSTQDQNVTYHINPLGIDVADIPVITDIDVIVPGLITMVYFSDGGKEKMRLQDGDTWDLITCCYYALAKHLYRKTLNYKGIEYMANMLSMYKSVEKMVNKAAKQYNQGQKRAQERKERHAKSKNKIKGRKTKGADKDNSDSTTDSSTQVLMERLINNGKELCQVTGVNYDDFVDKIKKIINDEQNYTMKGGTWDDNINKSSLS